MTSGHDDPAPAWPPGWRQRLWRRLDDHGAYDVLVIGGGITGAGILREAARRGLSALLVEQRDFAWGTSSRSSKMVHGGLRYIAAGDIKLTRESVTERERFLREAPGLVEPMPYVFVNRSGQSPGRWSLKLLMTVYDLIARRRTHRYLTADELAMHLPYVDESGLEGGMQYIDAITDDCRLVLRVLDEALADGAAAANYVTAERLVVENGETTGAVLRDAITGEQRTARARVVVNATGAWADRLRGELVDERRIRPLRGSHLVFPAWRLPVFQCLTLLHPEDGRPIFIYPWEGATIVGTTDLDHRDDLDREASISQDEIDYLMRCVHREFPALEIGERDIHASFSGVRPIIGTGASDPSKERRDHMIWTDAGLVTVSGGKLTTFRLIARDVLETAAGRLPEHAAQDGPDAVFRREGRAAADALGPDQVRRLTGYYGDKAQSIVGCAAPGELDLIPGTRTLWAELRWAARAEAVQHLDDLLLRRTRVGLLLPCGATARLDGIRAICQPELGWDDDTWAEEVRRYEALWVRHYSLPEASRAASCDPCRPGGQPAAG